MLLVAAARVPNLAAAGSPMGAANVGSSGILNSPATRARPGPDLVWRGGYAASVWNSGWGDLGPRITWVNGGGGVGSEPRSGAH